MLRSKLAHAGAAAISCRAIVFEYAIAFEGCNRPYSLTGSTHIAAQLVFVRARTVAEILLEQCGVFWKTRRPELGRLPRHERVQLSAAEVGALMHEAQRGVETKLRQNDVLTAWL